MRTKLRLVHLLLLLLATARGQQVTPYTPAIKAGDTMTANLTVPATCTLTGPINAKACYQAAGDLQFSIHNCAVTTGSSSLSCREAIFAATDVGKTIYVDQAGSGAGTTIHSTLQTTISTYTSPTQVTLSNRALATNTSASIAWGTDDTLALQTAFNAAARAQRQLFIPKGNYLHHGLNWTGVNGIEIRGDGVFGMSDLYAMSVTNPTAVNSSPTAVGVDISSSSENKILDLSMNGGVFFGMFDIAPTVNVLAARALGSDGKVDNGTQLSVEHTFDHVYTETSGAYDFVLVGYEQADFLNSHFQVDAASPVAALYLSGPNTPGFVSPYITVDSRTNSMTKVTVSGAATEFEGTGNMIVFDNADGAPIYQVAIRDAYSHLNPAANGNCAFLVDTAPSSSTAPLRHIAFDQVYVETETSENCQFLKINAPAVEWHMSNVQKYGPVATYSFTGATSSNSHTITSVSAITPGYAVGQILSGPGIEPGTAISTIGPATIGISRNARSSGSGTFTVSVVGNAVNPFVFAGGFLDSEIMLDAEGPGNQFPSGAAFGMVSAPSCAGSTLHLGSSYPTATCTDFVSACGVSKGVGLCLPSSKSQTVSANGCTITPGAIGNSCGSTVSFTAGGGVNEPDTNYKIAGCTLMQAAGNTVLGNTYSASTTGFIINSYAMSTTATGAGIVTCTITHP